METRHYRPDEAIEVGDVVLSKHYYFAFNTSIVVAVDSGMVELSRIHAQVVKIGRCPSTVFTAVETWRLDLKSFRSGYLVFTEGDSGEKSNYRR